MIFKEGRIRNASFVASTPSISGMSMSISTTSQSTKERFSTNSFPLEAS